MRRALLTPFLALSLSGCGGSSALVASGFRSGPPARYAGLSADAGMRTATVPTWRQQVRNGDRLTVSVVLRNASKETITVTGQGKGDPGRDGVWRPDSVQGAPVRLGPHQARRVTFIGHAECDSDHALGLYSFGRTDVAYGGSTQDLDLNGLLQVGCSG